MDIQTFRTTLKQELPIMLREDPNLRLHLIDLTRSEYADRLDTQDRFHQILLELRQDREAQARKWDQQNRKWDEQNRKWEALQAETREEFRKVHEEIMAQAKKHERIIGALGSRWGMQSERTFRNALAGILEESFGVQVLNVNEYDHTGTVFGRPEQIELDVIIKNGLLLICELKSSIDKAGMYSFERKARFYEKLHQRQANRLLVISPMVDPRALKVAENLGIEVYSDAIDVQTI